jgi:hypothetical protein
MEKIQTICLIAHRVKLFKVYCLLLDPNANPVKTYEKFNPTSEPNKNKLSPTDIDLVNNMNIEDIINGEQPSSLIKFFKDDRGICDFGDFFQKYMKKLNNSTTQNNEHERAMATALAARETMNAVIEELRVALDSAKAKNVSDNEANISQIAEQATNAAKLLSEKENALAELAALTSSNSTSNETLAQQRRAAEEEAAKYKVKGDECDAKLADATTTIETLSTEAQASKTALQEKNVAHELQLKGAMIAYEQKIKAETEANAAALAAEQSAHLLTMDAKKLEHDEALKAKQALLDSEKNANAKKMEAQLKQSLEELTSIKSSYDKNIAEKNAIYASQTEKLNATFVDSKKLAQTQIDLEEALRLQKEYKNDLEKYLKEGSIPMKEIIEIFLALRILVPGEADNGHMFNPKLAALVGGPNPIPFKLTGNNAGKWTFDTKNLSTEAITNVRTAISSIRGAVKKNST